MRNEADIRERIQMAIVEEMQSVSLVSEPENWLPRFVDMLTNKLTEICLDEIAFRPR